MMIPIRIQLIPEEQEVAIITPVMHCTEHDIHPSRNICSTN